MALPFQPTPASSFLNPTTGLLTGIAQGAKSFIDAFHQAKMDALEQQKVALENQFRNKNYARELEQSGLQERPGAFNTDGTVKDGETAFTVSPAYLQRQKAVQDLQRQQDVFKTTLQTQADLVKDRGATVPGLGGFLGDSVGVPLPNQGAQPQPAQQPEGLLPPGLLKPAQPAAQSAPDAQGGGLLAPRAPQSGQAPAATSPAAVPIPGLGLSPKLEQVNLENKIKQRDLGDPTKGLPQPAQDRIKDLGQKDTDLVDQYTQTLGRYKIVADPKQSSRARFDTAILAMQDLVDKGNMPRGPAFEKLTSDIKRFNAADPGSLKGRDYDAVAATIKNALDVMGQRHQGLVKQETSYGYTPPKEVRNLPPAPDMSGARAPQAPAVGAVRNGYRFKGGNPAQQSSWEKM